MKTMCKLALPALVVFLYAVGLTAGPDTKTTKNFSVKPKGTLELSSERGDVSITPWEKNEVYIRAFNVEGKGRHFNAEQNGNVVQVQYKDDDSFYQDDVRFEINVPSSFDLKIQTAGGDLAVKGALNGNVQLLTAGGSIELKEIHGESLARTAGGDVEAGFLDGDSDLNTSGGDITVKRSEGKLKVQTAGGNIDIEIVGSDLQAGTSGGDITVGSVGGKMELYTSGGDIDAGTVEGNAKLKTSGGDIRLKAASGNVNAYTAGGSVIVGKISGSLDANTVGGDVVATLAPIGKGSSELYTNGGDIVLHLGADAKASIEAEISGMWSSDDDSDIVSDFPRNKADKKPGADRATFTLNGGGHTIRLKTMNGNIKILKKK